ncbi:hypothetical protein HT031_002309 [Scenedesmus sp. PABB004]|nr:hypothetical protein HT031_002309 [Scenedesmus sp. PABB004]
MATTMKLVDGVGVGAAGRKRGAEDELERKKKTSPYLGVCWNKKNKRWQTAINAHGRCLYLGSFEDEAAAARAYDVAALAIRGGQAETNFEPATYQDAHGQLVVDPKLRGVIDRHLQVAASSRLAAYTAKAVVGNGGSLGSMSEVVQAAVAAVTQGGGAGGGGRRAGLPPALASSLRQAAAGGAGSASQLQQVGQLLASQQAMGGGATAGGEGGHAAAPRPASRLLFRRPATSGQPQTQMLPPLPVHHAGARLQAQQQQHHQHHHHQQQQQQQEQEQEQLPQLQQQPSLEQASEQQRLARQLAQQIVRPPAWQQPPAQPGVRPGGSLGQRPPQQSQASDQLDPALHGGQVARGAPGATPPGAAQQGSQPAAAGAAGGGVDGDAPGDGMVSRHSVYNIRMSWLLAQLPPSAALEGILPGAAGMFGVVYSQALDVQALQAAASGLAPPAPAARQACWVATVWDGVQWQHVGCYATEGGAYEACHYVLDLAGDCFNELEEADELDNDAAL